MKSQVFISFHLISILSFQPAFKLGYTNELPFGYYIFMKCFAAALLFACITLISKMNKAKNERTLASYCKMIGCLVEIDAKDDVIGRLTPIWCNSFNSGRNGLPHKTKPCGAKDALMWQSTRRIRTEGRFYWKIIGIDPPFCVLTVVFKKKNTV